MTADKQLYRININNKINLKKTGIIQTSRIIPYKFNTGSDANVMPHHIFNLSSIFSKDH